MKEQKIQNIIRKYLRNLELSSLAKLTIKNYRSDIGRFEEWIKRNQIITSGKDTEEMMSSYLWELKHSRNITTYKRNKSSLNKFYQWMKEEKYIEEKQDLFKASQKVEYKTAFALIIIFLIMMTSPLLGKTYPRSINLTSDSLIHNKDMKTSSPVKLTGIKEGKTNNDSWFLGPIEIEGSAVKQVTLVLDNNLTKLEEDAANDEITFKLAAENPIIIDETEEKSDIQLTKNKGKGIIFAGKTETVITDEGIMPFSLILITATSLTNNQVIYIKEQSKGGFSAGIEKPIERDITFNWFIE